MIVGRWYVQLAAIWHWYLPLCIYMTVFVVVLEGWVGGGGGGNHCPFFSSSIFFNLILTN